VWDQRFDSILREHMPHVPVDYVISPDEQMVSLGVTSMLLLSLMLTLEKEYEIQFPMDALTEDSFRSPSSIWLAVESLHESQLLSVVWLYDAYHLTTFRPPATIPSKGPRRLFRRSPDGYRCTARA
jgi:acyl carrier protein